jgi:diguanylate cyclase (GGDEF)-like protein
LNESPLLDKAGHYAGQRGMITDLTERNGLEHELAFRGVHDPLTGLPNRLLLVDRLELALGRATPGAGAVAVACVDVDAFKEVNTAHGHDGGDQILVEMAARLTGTIGAGDTVARFGGDESVVICEGRGPFAERLAERISAVISTPYAVGESHIDINARVGVAVGLQGVLEITEAVLMDDVQHSVSALGALRQTGVTIAIDDFGTGYSSLSYLQRFPIDALKIDQSFVAGLPENDYDMALVRAVMAISGALNRSVIAEGVESEEQATALLQMGCKGSRATTSIDR